MTHGKIKGVFNEFSHFYVNSFLVLYDNNLVDGGGSLGDLGCFPLILAMVQTREI